MDLVGDERAQSVQIGAVLLFGVLVVSFSSYQAFVVPEQNREVEFNHNQQVHSQMQELRNAIVSQADGGSLTATSVSLGTQYPSRLVSVNPGPPSGSLRTAGADDPSVNVTIRDATAAGETGDYWNVTTSSGRAYGTGTVVYDPSYNVYTNPPETVYDQTVLYNEFPNARLTLANQSLIDGDRISLVTIDGSFDRSSSGTTSVDVRPISSSTREIQIESPDADTPITLVLVSQQPASRWAFLETSQPAVDAVEDAPTPAPTGFHTVAVKLDPDRTYRLQMTKVGVGSGAEQEPVAYLTDVAGDDATVTKGESTTVTLEVRDAYNNPVSGVEIFGAVDGEGSLGSASKVSDPDGRVEFTYATYESTETGTHTLQFSTDEVDDSFDGSTAEDVTMSVTVTESGGGSGSGGGSDDSGGGPGKLEYNDDAVAIASGDATSGVEFTVSNTGNKEIDITSVRIDPAAEDITCLTDTIQQEGEPAPQESELYIEADTDGYTDFSSGVTLPETIDVDNDGVKNGPNPRLSTGSTARFHLFRFHEQGDSNDCGDEVDMDGEDVTITVDYDGPGQSTGSKEFTINPDEPDN